MEPHSKKDCGRMFGSELRALALSIILFLLTACVVAAGGDPYHHQDGTLTVADSRSIEGIWSITANDVPGRLEFFWTGRGWGGRIKFDFREPGEELANVFFDHRTGQLQFIRPRYNQTYSGTFMGNQISGTFTEAGGNFPWLARREALRDLRDIRGLWHITANDVPGKLEFFPSRKGWSGQIQFDFHEPGEELVNIFFNHGTGQLQFFRPRYNQTYSGTLSGNQISGSFTEAGRSFPWVARRPW